MFPFLFWFLFHLCWNLLSMFQIYCLPLFLENDLLEFPKYLPDIFSLFSSLEKAFYSLLIQMKSAELHWYYLSMLRMNF